MIDVDTKFVKLFLIPKNTNGPVTVVKVVLLAQDEVWFYAIMLL